MSSIKDVAREAQVSTATVSRVLAEKGSYKAETRERILAAIAKLDYRPNLIARSLRAQTSTKIGLVVSDIRNPFFTEIARAVEDAAYENGYSVLICNTDENPDKESLYLDLMRDENVAGVIFSPTQQFNPARATTFGFPLVMIDRSIGEGAFDAVQLDNVNAAYELTEHLIKQGYRQLAGLFGSTSTTGVERQQGFLTALAAHGMTAVTTQFVAPRIENGVDATMILLNQYPQIDALFTSNSLLTAGAFQALRARGMRIPEEVGLVGFDQTTWGNLIEPAITLIAQPTKEIGRTAVEILFKRAQEPDRAYRKIMLKGSLQINASSVSKGKNR